MSQRRHSSLIPTRDKAFIYALAVPVMLAMLAGCSSVKLLFEKGESQATLVLRSQVKNNPLKLDGLFFETAQGRIELPAGLTGQTQSDRAEAHVTMTDGRVVTVSVRQEGKNSV